MKRVLVLGVSSVQYDAIKFLKNSYTDVEVHAVAMKNDGPGANIADIFNEINILYVEKIVQYVLDEKIDLIYSVGSDIAMPIASIVSEKLGLPHFISSEVAKNCNNKNLMRGILGDSFEGNVHFQTLSHIKDFQFEVFESYPIFLKPADSQGQRGVSKISSYKQLANEFENTKSYSRSGLVILEKYIDGPEISVNGYLVNGVLKICEVSDRITWKNFEGLIHKHVLSVNFSTKLFDQTFDLLQRASNKMGILNGPVYAQMKIENDKPYIIEVTPRLDGCHMWNLINHAKDVNLLKLTFDHLLFNDLTELDKYNITSEKTMTLEFLCQEPNTVVKYPENFFMNSITDFKYYNEGDLIRPVNNKFEKIAYKIY